jgi:uncharacterized membrane protein YphA (DoxX/SURF4 family)
MSASRRIARPLLASVFVAGGVDALRHPETKAKSAQAVTVHLTRWMPSLPDDPDWYVRADGALQVGAGLLLAAGRFRRLAAVALIVSLVPNTYAANRFWEEEDEAARPEQRTRFLVNLGLLGGLILEAVDTEGAPSLGWRARRRAGRIAAVVATGSAVGGPTARSTGSSVTGRAVGFGRHAQDAAAEVGNLLDRGAARAPQLAQVAAHRTAELAGELPDRAAGVIQR